MSNATDNREIGAYEQELCDTLLRLKEEAPPIQALDYFFRLVQNGLSSAHKHHETPRVIVLGTSVPEELIYAAGANPHWVLGGSARAGSWAGELAPRDTDPVSRSMLGYLNGNSNFESGTLHLIPVVNDSNRKLAYLLRRAGKRVHTIDFPPVKSDEGAQAWRRQLERCGETLSAYTGRAITAKSLRRAECMVSACRKQMRRFLTLTDGSNAFLPGTCRMFVLNSYYYTSSIEDWCHHMDTLNRELEAHPHRQKPGIGSHILLLGSPVYFPGYKVPFLLQDAGLHISAHMDCTTQKLFIPASELFYQQDCSAAYPKNDALYASVSHFIVKAPLDGVVYQVLKGQIEYDFELERLEALFAAHDLPVFRLETDYNAQDVEQLRIRMDAFVELLTQRRYRKEAQAV